jgi:hypothetical protein
MSGTSPFFAATECAVARFSIPTAATIFPVPPFREQIGALVLMRVKVQREMAATGAPGPICFGGTVKLKKPAYQEGIDFDRVPGPGRSGRTLRPHEVAAVRRQPRLIRSAGVPRAPEEQWEGVRPLPATRRVSGP